MPGHRDDVTALLRAWGEGDEQALHQLMPLVERELNRVAHACLAGDGGNRSVSATALVNEAFLRLVALPATHWENRSRFFALSARLMRQILVDAARARRGQKRGGTLRRVPFDERFLVVDTRCDFVALNDALSTLATLDPRRAQVVELRFFGGLTVAETAEALQMSSETVMRDWKLAKAWLLRELNESARDDR